MSALKKPGRAWLLPLSLILLLFLLGCERGSLDVAILKHPEVPVKPIIHRFDLPAQQALRDLTADFSVRESGADSGITLLPGEKVEIFASGSASLQSGGKQSGPEGIPGCHESTMPEPSLSCYAVIYSLGVNGHAGEVGAHVGFNSASEGNLFLGVNAPHLATSNGSFHITVLVVPPGTFTGLWVTPQKDFVVQGKRLVLSAYVFAQNVMLDGVLFTMTEPGKEPVPICQASQSGEDLYTCNWSLTTLDGSYFHNGSVTLGFRLDGRTASGAGLNPAINPDGALTGTVTYIYTQPTSNYAGYAATDFSQTAAYQKVSGRWVVPSAHCSPGEDSDVSVWVGMSSDESEHSLLAQLGSATDCRGGIPQYYLWWEMYPAPSVEINRPVKPGDTITATVAFQHDSFQLSMDIPSEGIHFSTTQAGKVSDTSVAECIVEPDTIVDDPTTDKGHLEHLTNFGQISVHCQLNQDKPIADGPQDILYQMQTSAGVAKTVTSPLDQSGTTFTVQWRHS